MPTDQTHDQVEQSLEDHELAVKRALDSLGSLEDGFEDVISEASTDERAQYEPLGRALEMHVERLEKLVRTLDDHKRAVRDDSDERMDDGLAAALERSRQRARQEPTPQSPDEDTREW